MHDDGHHRATTSLLLPLQMSPELLPVLVNALSEGGAFEMDGETVPTSGACVLLGGEFSRAPTHNQLPATAAQAACPPFSCPASPPPHSLLLLPLLVHTHPPSPTPAGATFLLISLMPGDVFDRVVSERHGGSEGPVVRDRW